MRVLRWLDDRRHALRARYHTWQLFRAWPWRWLPAHTKRRTP